MPVERVHVIAMRERGKRGANDRGGEGAARRMKVEKEDGRKMFVMQRM